MRSCDTPYLLFWGGLLLTLVLIINIFLLWMSSIMYAHYWFQKPKAKSRRAAERCFLCATIICWIGILLYGGLTINMSTFGFPLEVLIQHNTEPTTLWLGYFFAVLLCIFQSIMACILHGYKIVRHDEYHSGEEFLPEVEPFGYGGMDPNLVYNNFKGQQVWGSRDPYGQQW